MVLDGISAAVLALHLNKRWRCVAFQLAVSLACAFYTFCAYTRRGHQRHFGCNCVPPGAADDEPCQGGISYTSFTMRVMSCAIGDQDGINWRNVAPSSPTSRMKIPPIKGTLVLVTMAMPTGSDWTYLVLCFSCVNSCSSARKLRLLPNEMKHL